MLRAFTALTTPLLPEDYLGLVDPLWSQTVLRGRVVAVRRETARATTLTIKPGRRWKGHRAGQFVRLGVDVDGVRHWRTYSLNGNEDSRLLSVTVQALPGGIVSPQLAHGTPVGTGRVEHTQPMIFSADETTDIGQETGTTVTPDYTPRTSRFTGKIRWVQLDEARELPLPTITGLILGEIGRLVKEPPDRKKQRKIPLFITVHRKHLMIEE